MNRKVSYKDCLNFIENKLHIKLFNYQKEIIRCFCENQEIRTARGIGRSICAEAYGKYIANLYDKNDYNIEPTITIPYDAGIKNNVLQEKSVEAIKKNISRERFEKDFLCK